MVLTSGAVLAQIISYLIAPILTRIYSTDEMGDLGLYLRAVGFISALATARYELSIPLAKSDLHSFILYRLALRIAICILIASALIGVVYFVTIPFQWFEFVMILSVLASSFFMVLINLGTNWSIRHNQFNKIAFSKMSNSLVANLLRWLCGVLHFGSIGLLMASLIGYLVSCMTFVRELVHQSKEKHDLISRKKMYVLSREYRDFPLVSLPHVVIDLGRDLLIAALVVTLFSKHIYGSFNHSYTILRLPLMLIGASIGQVFYSRCSILINEGKSIYPLIKKTFMVLMFLSIVPFGLIFFFGEPLFIFVFSEEWGLSGKYSEIMTIWLIINFVISPVSGIPMILKRQREYFFIGLVGSAFQIFCFAALPFLIGRSDEDFILILWVMSISQALYMLFGVFYALHIAKVGVKVRKS